jgi:hypothetical protein
MKLFRNIKHLLLFLYTNGREETKIEINVSWSHQSISVTWKNSVEVHVVRGKVHGRKYQKNGESLIKKLFIVMGFRFGGCVLVSKFSSAFSDKNENSDGKLFLYISRTEGD